MKTKILTLIALSSITLTGCGGLGAIINGNEDLNMEHTQFMIMSLDRICENPNAKITTKKREINSRGVVNDSEVAIDCGGSK